MTIEEARKFLGVLPPEQTTSNLTPLTSAAVSGSTVNAPATPSGRFFGVPVPSFEERNVADNVELDIHSGAPKGTYFLGALNLLKEQELAYYQGLYGEDKVRRADTGDLIFRINDPDTGQPKDVVANPKGLGLHDFLGLAAQAPAMAAALVVGLRGGKLAPGFVNAAKVALRSSGAAAVTGGAQDLLTQTAQGRSRQIDPLEVIKSRGKEMAVDLSFGAGLGVLGKIATKARSPFAAAGIRVDATTANQILARELNVEPLPMSVAQITGNPTLGRVEAFMLKLPGSSGRLEAKHKQFVESVQNVQNALMGLPPHAKSASAIGTAEDVGGELVEAVGAPGVAAARAEERARKAVLSTGKAEASALAARRVNRVDPVDRIDLGSRISTKAKEIRDKFQAESREAFEEIRSDQRVRAFVVEPKGLAVEAKDTLENLASQRVQKTRQGGLLDEFARPIEVTEEVTEHIPEFIPPGLLTRLRAVAETGKAKLRMTDLMAMRTDVRNAIAEGKAIPDFNTGQLEHLHKQLTDAIDDGFTQIGDSALHAKWKDATKKYAVGAERFENRGIAPLFRSPESALTPEEIVNRAIKGEGAGGVYRDYKAFFGESSPEFQDIRRAVVDHVFDRPFDPRRVSISGKELVDKLRELKRTAPEMAKDVFGDDMDKAFEIAESIGVAQGTIKFDDLATLVGNRKSLTYNKLREFIRSGEAKARAYSNNLIKEASEGTLDPSKINPSEFVDEFAFKAKPSDVRAVAGALARDFPETLQVTRQKTVQRLFDKASRWGDSPEATAAMLRGEAPPFNPAQLAKELGEPGSDTRARLEAVLGMRTAALLEKLAVATGPAHENIQAAASVGGIAAGSQVGQMMRGELAFIERAAMNLLGSIIYTDPRLERWAANMAFKPERAAVWIAAMISSAPMAKAITEALTTETGSEKLAVLRASQINEGLANMVHQQATGSTAGDLRLMTPNQAREFLTAPGDPAQPQPSP